MLQQGNEVIVTGLRDALPPPQSNQGINDDQNIDLGYDSAEDIAAQIERERACTEAQIQVQQREANRLKGLRILKLQQDERRQKTQENERVRQEIETIKQQINKAKEQQALETVRRQCEPTGIELQRLAQLQQEVDKLNSGQRDDFSTMSKEQLQRHCLALERQKEFLKQQADKREREATENLDRRKWRSKLTVPRVGKGPGTLKYPEWVATLTNLEKANGIPSREATQFWKEGLDNEAAREAHECKTPAEVKEVVRKLYWMEADSKRSKVEFAGFRRIPGETILQTKPNRNRGEN
jgi:hypothetical protein